MPSEKFVAYTSTAVFPSPYDIIYALAMAAYFGSKRQWYATRYNINISVEVTLGKKLLEGPKNINIIHEYSVVRILTVLLYSSGPFPPQIWVPVLCVLDRA